MKDVNLPLLILLFVVILVGVIAAVGSLFIWSLNTLFGLGIDYGVFEILAAALLVSFFSGGLAPAVKNK